MVNLIRSVINTLDSVEIKGRHNMDKLLGSINALETLAAALDSVAVPEKETLEDHPPEAGKEEANG